MIDTMIIAIAWAGIVMLFDFTMWEGNIFSFYHEFLVKASGFGFLFKAISKILGLCKICFSFWFGLLYILLHTNFDWQKALVFTGISEGILIFYVILILFYNKIKNN